MMELNFTPDLSIVPFSFIEKLLTEGVYWRFDITRVEKEEDIKEVLQKDEKVTVYKDVDERVSEYLRGLSEKVQKSEREHSHEIKPYEALLVIRIKQESMKKEKLSFDDLYIWWIIENRCPINSC